MNIPPAHQELTEIGTPPFWPLVGFSLTRVRYAYLLIPLLAGAGFAYLVHTGVIRGNRRAIREAEVAALVMLSIALLVAAARWGRHRAAGLLWITCLLLVLLAREIHFRGTSTGTYICLVILCVAAWRRYPRLAPWLGSRNVLTWLAVAFFSYTLSQGLDHHWFAFIPGEPVFERMTEELVELVGHSCVLGLALFARESRTLDPSRLRNLPRIVLLKPWNAAAAAVILMGIALWVLLLTDFRLLRMSHCLVLIGIVALATGLLYRVARGRATPVLMNAATLPVLVATVVILVLLSAHPALLVRDAELEGEASEKVLATVRAPKRGKIARVELTATPDRGTTVRLLLRYSWAPLERPVAELPPEAAAVAASRPAKLVEWDGIRRLRWLETDQSIPIPRIPIERALGAWLLLAATGLWLSRRRGGASTGPKMPGSPPGGPEGGAGTAA